MSSADPTIRASAPGKLILFGEHAVVYGEPALGLPLSMTVDVTIAPGSGRVTASLEDGTKLRASKKQRAATPDELARAALGSILDDHDVTIALGVPPMAGLGSSAALAIALLRARARLTGERLARSAVLDEAIAIEGVAHGRSSGVDPAIALAAAPILYTRSPNGRKTLAPVRFARAVHLVVGTRGGHGGTRGRVGGIAVLRDQAPKLVGAALHTLGEATREGARHLATGELEAVGRAMDLAHGVLAGLGLVGERIQEICRVARATGALGAKMSGAGGDGGAFVVLAPDRRRATTIARALGALEGTRAWVETFAPPASEARSEAKPSVGRRRGSAAP